MNIIYQIYDGTNPNNFDNLICEGSDRQAVISEAIEYKKDCAANNDVTEWELDAILVEYDLDCDAPLGEYTIYKCGVLN